MKPSTPTVRAPSLTGAIASRRARSVLLAAIGITIALYAIPRGEILAYPLILLSTLAHEMGHGIAGLLVGAHFDSFRMWGDASGLARVSGVSAHGFAPAFVSAGGLVGPALVAALLFACARGQRLSRLSLLVGGLALLVAMPLFIRGGFGLVFVGLVALALLAVGLLVRGGGPQIAVAFLAVQLALSVFSRGDYLFTEKAQTGAGLMPSDVANMATALGGPYWLWGFLCGAFSVLVLLAGTWVFLRRARGAAPRPLP